MSYDGVMPTWTFLTNHGRVLLCIGHDPDTRFRDIAATLGITERRAYGIVADLVEAGYVIKTRDGRRNRYEIQAHLPMPELTGRARVIGEVLDLLVGAEANGAGGDEGPQKTGSQTRHQAHFRRSED